MNIQEFRKQYPQYNDLSDQKLADNLYQKSYSDMDRMEFDRKFLGEQVRQMGRVAEYGAIRPGTVADRPLLEQLGRGAAKGLPLTGMAAGGTLFGVPGAGILGGVGKNIQRIIEQQMGWEEPKPLAEEYVDIGLSGIEAMGAEMGGQIVGKGLGLGLEKVMKPAGEKVAQLFREGFPVTKGTVTEGISRQIPPGSWWFKRWGRKLNEMVKASAEQFKRKDLKLLPKETPYPEPKEIDMAIDKWIAGSGGEKATINAGHIGEWLHKHGKRMGEIRVAYEPLANTLDKVRSQVKKTGKIAMEDINTIFMQAWRTYGTKKHRHLQPMFGKLKEMAMNDLKIAEQATGMPTYSGRMKVEELYKFGPEINRSRFMEGLFRKSTVYIEETGEYVFQPVKFKETILNNYSTIVKKFGKQSDVPELSMAFASKMEAAGRDLAAYIKMRRTGTGTELLKTAGVYGPAAWAGGVPGIVVPAGFNTWMGHSLAHPRGIMKRILFREAPGAFLTRAGKETTKAGIMLFPKRKEEKTVIRKPVPSPRSQ